ncbi:protein NRT1/ PTR FAMILY 7.3-like isoform X1 [Carex littledalei]|uniref:Protein NRT1/ PTR FAMILY 7.3-like isoform X1 n=1 Tax=Carex littledalei TaxID=544730 RepID=A0A833RIF2_9POAL|nr:protein NRT1/ PTR FAMILY 7.3-like isoform X1 [Carex littledalei]
MMKQEDEMKVKMDVMYEEEESDEAMEEVCCGHTEDGSVDFRGKPALKNKSGRWFAGIIILVNQGLATLAFFGVSVNLVLFLTRVLHQSNEDAANNVSKWTGTVYMFSLIGAFLSDSYWGRYKTCAVFQVIFVLGLVLLSVSTQLLLIRPQGCGNEHNRCSSHSSIEVLIFYISLYMIALGNGGYQPNIATFGSDQFDESDGTEAHSKVSFFSYFYLSLNLGSLFSNTFLSYLEDNGAWALGFWASGGAAVLALILFIAGTTRYRYFRPCGNPLSRVSQVLVASSRKWKVMGPLSDDHLYEQDGSEIAEGNGSRKMLHTEGFRCLDRAAYVDVDDFTANPKSVSRDPWRLCTVTQVEEVKSVLRLLPIWLCTIIYSVVFTQMASLFVVQGAAMRHDVFGFSIPPASMSAFDILSVAAFIFLYRQILQPLACRFTGNPCGLTELQRMGIGLLVATVAMLSAGTVEYFRLKMAIGDGTSRLHIIWQMPQYALVGASEVFMYVGQLEFFNRQTPDGLKSFGSALCMTSMSLGNYFSDAIVTAVMKVTTVKGRAGWIPEDLNEGHMDRFYFMLAVLTVIDFVVYVMCAKWYKCIRIEGKSTAVYH